MVIERLLGGVPFGARGGAVEQRCGRYTSAVDIERPRTPNNPLGPPPGQVHWEGLAVGGVWVVRAALLRNCRHVAAGHRHGGVNTGGVREGGLAVAVLRDFGANYPPHGAVAVVKLLHWVRGGAWWDGGGVDLECTGPAGNFLTNVWGGRLDSCPITEYHVAGGAKLRRNKLRGDGGSGGVLEAEWQAGG